MTDSRDEEVARSSTPPTLGLPNPGLPNTRPPAATPLPTATPLSGRTVVVIGGSSGIGRETADRARMLGADVILTGRDADRVRRAGDEIGALSTTAFDATEREPLERFFAQLPKPVDHVFVTAGGSYYAPVADLDIERVRGALDEHLLLTLNVAQLAIGRVREGGSLLFITGTAARHPAVGSAIAGIFAAALPALVANLALELAPIRVNLIAAGFVDTPLSAAILGDDLDVRRAELRKTLPIRRVVESADVADLAVQIMINSALTGATFDIDGGQQLLAEG
jgi:NAD(P)-dependent dehydrogenase (short-subunit alcohol dehydrogenase family)